MYVFGFVASIPYHVEIDGDVVGPSVGRGLELGNQQRRGVVAAGPALARVGGEVVHEHQGLALGVHGPRLPAVPALPCLGQAVAAVLRFHS
jgi:hypothetical protein